MKTRLFAGGGLTPRQACEVHEACLRDTVALVESVRGCEKWLFVAAAAVATRKLAGRLGLGRGWRVASQRGRDLGERLAHALQWLQRGGRRRVVVVGTDTPWMGARRVRQAMHWLHETDVVLGPTQDGGYYLVGMRKLVPEMFLGIAWGSRRVFRQTVRALERASVPYRELCEDFDLDRAADLKRAAKILRRNATRAKHLAARLRKKPDNLGG